MPFASGKHAWGLCDICGFRCDYTRFRYYIYAQRNTRLKVCPDCYDQDQPQLQLGRVRVADWQGLYEPRPDTGINGANVKNSRLLTSWNPIGSNMWAIQTAVGQLSAKGS